MIALASLPDAVMALALLIGSVVWLARNEWRTR